ncbi:MAG: Ni,Fe-hydrogenase I large subunit [Methylobacter sp.]
MPAGAIRIDLYHRCGRATGVKISSSRPDKVARVLIGKTPEQVLDTVPLLFTLCGNAQAYVALQACRKAMGLTATPRLDSARDMLVQLETLREHAWRILLDWPVFADSPPDKKSLAALLQFDSLFKRHLFRDGEAFKLDSRLDVDAISLRQHIDDVERLIDVAIFNGGQACFRQLSDEGQLHAWLQQNNGLAVRLLSYLYNQRWETVGQNGIVCLPDLQTDALDGQIRLDPAFSLKPHWQGQCFETTLLNRQLAQALIAGLHSRYGNGLIVRTSARLLELALIPCRLRLLLTQIQEQADLPANIAADDGIGLAQVQAARGLLIHRLELKQRKIHDHCIVAPTEWNFHPNGVIAEALKNLQAESSNGLQRQAELLINAVDPCVQYTLHLTNNSSKEMSSHA